MDVTVTLWIATSASLMRFAAHEIDGNQNWFILARISQKLVKSNPLRWVADMAVRGGLRENPLGGRQ
jgi:hypothetical protein